ncbi:MAG: thioesterase [Lachnospiraceae bacterium]|nr:thioesterase [Lachnospiraceae bacterium]
MYAYNARVRYSEMGKNGKLSLISLLNHFQDCSTFHSEDLGLGYRYLQEQDLLWVLSAWQIIICRYPKLGENIIIATAPYEFRSVIGFRNFLMTTEDGAQLACANSVWALLDTKRGRPAKPTAEMMSGYQLAEKLPMDYADRKITVPAGGSLLSPIKVKGHHLDTNNHVNNGQYISIAMDLLSDCQIEAEISQLRAEYKKSAVLGDIMYPDFVTLENAYIISLNDGEGKPYCIAEFKT